jgi:uncharacterized protein with von Willebrand factor type A (vWA) domain
MILIHERTDLVNYTFEGRVSIEGSVATSVSSITLHALTLAYNATLKSQAMTRCSRWKSSSTQAKSDFRDDLRKEVLRKGSSFSAILDFQRRPKRSDAWFVSI